MNLVNELSSELVLAFLVEKKHAEKLDNNDALALIGRVKEILKPLSAEQSADTLVLSSAINAKTGFTLRGTPSS